MKTSKKIPYKRWQWGNIPEVKPIDTKIDFKNLVSMGSGFADNFNRWLSAHRGTEPKELFRELFNPFSIYAEIQRVFEPADWEESIFEEIDVRTNEKKYRDPLNIRFSTISKDKLIEVNKQKTLIARELFKNASGFLITFGLSEIPSLQSNPEIIFNNVHPGAIYSGNFCSFRFASVSESQLVMTKLVKIIRKHVSATCPIIFTLSPIPLSYTFSELSAKEANNLSKAINLVALHQVVKNEDNVMYFPAYETIQALHEQGFPTWQEDGRHITAAAADQVARKFWNSYNIDNYIDTEALSDFSVAMANKKGRCVGKLYIDGSFELNETASIAKCNQV